MDKRIFSWKSLLKACTTIILLGLIYFFAFLHGYLINSETQSGYSNGNVLLLGHSRPAPSQLKISINRTACLNGFTRKQVYKLRTEMVLQHPELILGTYQPSESVFGQIVDGKQWWGIVGEFFYGPGQWSNVGDSEESRFILNPFLLASPELMGFSFYGSGKLRWKTDIDRSTLENAKFPFYCPPHDLKWYPQTASAEVTYSVSNYLSLLNKYASRPLAIGKDSTFELIAYNARDLGFNYVFIPLNGSVNIDNDHGELKAPLWLHQFIHCGNSCRYPGGCNNMSPAVPETDDLRITKLPAQLKLLFWRHQPETVSETPDITYTIHFD